MGEMRRRFATVRVAMRKAIVDLDVFGLEERKPLSFHAEEPEREAFRFLTNPEKIEAFKKWFQRQVDAEILSVDWKGDSWTFKYVESAYRRGSIRAYKDSHVEEMGESPDFYRGRRDQFIESAFTQPERVQKLRMLFLRSFEDLKGITSAMSQQINRHMADGISHGQGPREIARTLASDVDNITKTRALTMARTEVIHVHAEGQLDSFEELGVQEIGVMAEWSTAGDDKVCPLCGALEGTVLTVKEARGLIPRHPNCRCAWIPANVGEVGGNRYWTQLDKKRRINKSLMAGLPKRTRVGVEVPQTVREARRRSTWRGKDLKPLAPPKGVDLD